MADLFVKMYENGGPCIVLILLASMVGLGYIIYCSLIIRRSVVMPKSLVELAERLEPNDLAAETALETCRREGGPFAEILEAVIFTRKAQRDEAESYVEAAGRRAAHDLSRGTLALEVVAAISPLLGLLGTVLGMHSAFGKIQDAGIKNFSKLSGDISEALVTTIAGLFVAIPAYVAFTWFARRIDDIVLDMERRAMSLMARIRG